MSESFQNEVPKARVNIRLELHTGGAHRKIELPLKLLVMGDFSNGREVRPLPERSKININKNNFDSVLADLNPKSKITVENTLAGDGSELPIDLDFSCMHDFKPDVIATKIPELRALMAARNLLRDLKSNLLDNVTFRRELEKILKNPAMSERLGNELNMIGHEKLKCETRDA